MLLGLIRNVVCCLGQLVVFCFSDKNFVRVLVRWIVQRLLCLEPLDFGCAIGVLYALWFYRSVIANLVVGCVVVVNPENLRGRFMRFRWLLPEADMPVNHSHPRAAAHRDGYSELITRFVNSVRARRFDVSTSKREMRNGIAGEKFYYCVKDMMTQFMWNFHKVGDIITLCDVDYYLSFRQFCRRFCGLPVLMYTFKPTTLAGKVRDGQFWHMDEETIVTRMLGGEEYYHKTYDYDKSMLVVPRWVGYWIYNIDRVAIGNCREIILFTPRTFIYDPLGIIGWWYGFSDCYIKRVRVTRCGDFLSMVHLGKKGMVRSIQFIFSRISCEVSEEAFCAMKDSFDIAKHSNISDVEKYLRAVTSETKRTALISPTVFRSLLESKVQVYLSVGLPAPSYQVVDDMDGLATEEQGKPTNVSCGPPIVQFGGPSPTETLVNDVTTVKMRVTEPHNTKVPPKKYECYAREFVKCLVVERGRGTPMSADEVIEKQSRPLQRMRSELMRYWSSGRDIVVKAFQKKETYGKVGAPRNISTTPPKHTVELSGFTYAFKYAILQYTHWYMPCKTPGETVKAVMDYVSDRDEINSSDYSSFDGTNSRWLRTNIELAAYKEFFAVEYHKQLENHLFAEFDASAITRQGVKYKPDGSRLSGSPCTTDGNCMLNAFASYCGYREKGFSIGRSWRLIGPKYGDDSLEGKECLLDGVCEDIGFKIKNDFIQRGSSLPFLGRVFINPWLSRRTIQDPLRTLIKIHQGFPDGRTTPIQTLINRVCGYAVTDIDTPIIGNYCKAIKRMVAGPVEYVYGIDKEMDFRVENGAWPICLELEAETVAVVAASCKLTPCDVVRVCTKIDSAEKLEDLEVFINNELIINIPAVVDGKLLTPP
jgi:hypothetical protein